MQPSRIKIYESLPVDFLTTAKDFLREHNSYRSCVLEFLSKGTAHNGMVSGCWLLVDTPKGVSVSAIIYSIVESAKSNGLNVYTYLEYLLLYMPDTDLRKHSEKLGDMIPCCEDVQAECK